MITIKCDQCGKQEERPPIKNGIYVPNGWIVFQNIEKVVNEDPDALLSFAGATDMHFCSKKCMNKIFFKEKTFVNL